MDRAPSNRAVGWAPASGIVGSGRTNGSAVCWGAVKGHVISVRVFVGSVGGLRSRCGHRILSWMGFETICY